MVDFDKLLYGPVMDAFARPITVTPLVSQPGQPAYTARGVWRIQPADMQLLVEDSRLATDTLTLEIRASEFAVVPKPGDRVFIPAHLHLPAIGLCEIADDGDDGQGGFAWVLKKIPA